MLSLASLVAQLVKNPPAMQETWFDPWVGKIPWRKERLPTAAVHGVAELDRTERLSLSLFYSYKIITEAPGVSETCLVPRLESTD